MSNLSPELLTHIFNDVEELHDLFTLRCASRQFCDILTPRVFSVLYIYANDKRATFVSSLLDCPNITKHVLEIIFQGDKNDDTENIPKLASVFASLSKFSALEVLRLRFYKIYMEDIVEDDDDNPSSYMQLQLAVLKSLSNATARPVSLHTFELSGFIAWHNEFYMSIEFQDIFKHIKTLSITVIEGESGDAILRTQHYEDFWQHDIPLILQNASIATSLTLACDDSLACPFFFETQALCLPNLASLTLRQMILDSGGVEQFIVAQKATLKHLKLDACFISQNHHMINSPPDRLWADVWRNFENTLVGLKVLEVNLEWDYEDAESDEDSGVRLGYCYWDTESGYIPNSGSNGYIPGSQDEDDAALQHLYRIIRA